jgi:membrane-bound hydrogenase subunit beta
MADEEKVKQQLETAFGFLKDAVVIKRKGRIFAEVPLEKFGDVFAYAVKQMQFDAITAITGLDEVNAFSVLYHIHRDGSVVLTFKVKLNRDNPVIKTVTPYFPSADAYERELVDLLGIKVEGLAPGHRYPMPDSWPKNEHPLRKDWKQSSGPKEVQNA